MENFIDEMINKKLIYNKKTDQGLDSLYKNTEIEEEHLLTYHTFQRLKIQTILKKILFVIYRKYYLNNLFHKLKI